AVDGLAVDTLRGGHLGYGNIAQVVGYKAGGILSGGVLLASTGVIGWSGVFAVLAALALAGFVATLRAREPAPEGAGAPPASVRDIVRVLGSALRAPGTGWLLALVATYKL